MKYGRFSFFLVFLLALTGFSRIYAQQDTSDVIQLIDESKSLAKVGDYNQALKLLKKSDSLSTQMNYLEGKAKTATMKADIFIDQNKIDEAHDLLVSALGNYPESEERAQFHNLLAVTFSRREMDINAVQEFEMAMEYLFRLPEKEHKRMELALMQNLAVVYSNLGQHEKAFNYYLDVIESAKEAQDTTILTLTYNNIGEAYNAEKQFERAQFYLEKALDLARSQNSKMDLYRGHLNYANVLSNQEKYQEALQHYNEAEKLITEVRPGAPPAIILHNKGATLAKMEQYQEAEELLNESLQMSTEAGIRQGMFFNYLVLGNMNLERKRYEEAIFQLKNAAEIAEEIPDLNPAVDAYETLHTAYAEAGQYTNAYEALQTFKSYSDSLAVLNKERELSGAETKIELSRQNEINQLLEEKQAQQEQRITTQYYLIAAAGIIIILIAVLLYMARKQAREREELLQELQNRKEELEELNKAKDRVFAIVSHDLRSPLTSVQGVLQVVKDDIIKGDELNNLIAGVDHSLRKNVEVIEDLLTWAKKQLSGFNLEIQHVDLKPILDDIVTSYSFIALQKKVNLESEVKQQSVKSDANAIRMIFRNLISNAIKYTEPGGTVKVQVTDLENKVRVAVSDNGMGIPESDQDKIFESITWTRIGTGNEKGSGFGLSLSKEFAERMNGKIWYESEEGKGTTFFVELPK